MSKGMIKCTCDQLAERIVRDDCPIHGSPDPTRDAEQAVREARELVVRSVTYNGAFGPPSSSFAPELDALITAVRQAERAQAFADVRRVVEGVVDDVGYYDRAIKTEILAAIAALSSEGT